MADIFVDTNVFLRFLTNDDPVKAKQAEALFRDAVLGKRILTTSLLVVAELVWTLESFYQLDKQSIASKIEKILNTPHLECPEASLILAALDSYVGYNVDFVDAYHAMYLKEAGPSRVYTYDRKHFARFAWLEIIEP